MADDFKVKLREALIAELRKQARRTGAELVGYSGQDTFYLRGYHRIEVDGLIAAIDVVVDDTLPPDTMKVVGARDSVTVVHLGEGDPS
jgi:hypothetical protein